MAKPRFLPWIFVLCLFFLIPAAASSGLEAPAIIAGNEKESGCVLLSWTPVQNAQQYRICRSAEENGEYQPLASIHTNVYLDYSASPGKTFFYYAEAVRGDETSPSSEVCRASARLPQPSLQLSGIQPDGSIRISWNEINGAEAYDLSRSSGDGEWAFLGRIGGTHFITTAPPAGVTHSYQLQAVCADPAASSVPSGIKSLSAPLPAPDLSMQITDQGKVKLIWKPVENAVSYEIYIAEKYEGPYQPLTSTSQTSYLHHASDAGQIRYYRVKALASVPEAASALSHIVSGSGQRTSAFSVSSTLADDGKPLLWWSRTGKAAYYQVYRSLYPDKNYSMLRRLDTTWYANPAAAEGVTYYYRITAFDAGDRQLETSEPIAITPPVSGTEVTETRYVAVPELLLYKLPSGDSATTALRYMAELQLGKAIITRDSGTWYRAFFAGQLYYYHAVSGAETLSSVKSTFTYPSQTPLQRKVIDIALAINQQKTIYRSGKSGWIDDTTLAFDCSGFVSRVLNTAMQPIVPTYRVTPPIPVLAAPRVLYNEGYPGEFSSREVGLDELEPGDILFFRSRVERRSSTALGHCGMYLGNQEFIHCTSLWQDAVCIMPLAGEFSDNLLKAVRFLPDAPEPANQPVTLCGDYHSYKVYAEMSSTSPVLAHPKQGDTLTLLYTSNSSWAYVRTPDGTEGFILTRHFQ